MPSTRFKKLPPETQRRILDVARAEFLACGYESASINRIIQAAGINKGSLYYYFEDKAHLFVSVAQDAQEELLRGVSELDVAQVAQHPPQDFWGYLERAVLHKTAFVVHHPDLARLFADFYRQASKPDAPARFKAFLDLSHGTLRTLLKMGQDQGAVRTDLPLDMLVELNTAMSEVMNRELIENPACIEGLTPDEIQRYASPQIDMMRRMLLPPEGGTLS